MGGPWAFLKCFLRSKMCCPRWGSNSRPSDYETDALPTALRRQDIKALQLISPWQPGESPASELKKYIGLYKSYLGWICLIHAYETLKSEGLLEHFSFVGFEPEILSVNLLKYFDFQMFLYSITGFKRVVVRSGIRTHALIRGPEISANPLPRDKAWALSLAP